MLDLDYAEDSTAETDANFVMTGSGGLVEVQGTAEGAPFSEAQLLSLLGAGARRHRATHHDAEGRGGRLSAERAYPSTQARRIWWAIAIGCGASSRPGMTPCQHRARLLALKTSARLQARRRRYEVRCVVACAMQPIIREAGNGQGCEAR